MGKMVTLVLHYASGPQTISNIDVMHASGLSKYIWSPLADGHLQANNMAAGGTASTSIELAGGIDSDYWGARFTFAADQDTTYVLVGQDSNNDLSPSDFPDGASKITLTINATNRQSGLIDRFGTAYLEADNSPNRLVFDIVSRAGAGAKILAGGVMDVIKHL